VVDFRARLKTKPNEQKVNPIELYNSLDRAVDKGPLRQAQEYILRDWFEKNRDDRDIIIKLHTGQGKTLIGLLILLSRINQGKGPALYLCPNNYLVNQTCTQALQFGIPYCEIGDDIPAEFTDGKKLLITTIQRLFNGHSRFGIGPKSQPVGTILVDDAHSSIEAIKKACTVVLERDSDAYRRLFTLFKMDLDYQGAGTAADIDSGSFDAIQYVPYWTWLERQDDVIDILSKCKDDQAVRFAWPLIKDSLHNCYCVFSGKSVEISPTITPIYLFGSFAKATQRIFMSATFFDDSFLVRGFGVSEKTIRYPLTFPDERWAGEKMVLIPSLIDDSLNRSEIVNFLASRKDQKFGIVVLSPSFNRTKDWASYNCTIANRDNIYDLLSDYKRGIFGRPLVIVNRYDGIDLPDQMCRLLVIDSKPFLGSLLDAYMQNCRENSVIIESKIAQTIEQGMGRAVRGEKDFCAIILIGPDLIKAIHSSRSRQYFSIQTRTQIEIGLSISEMAKDDIRSNEKPIRAFVGLVNQLLKRDEGWKDFYIQKMNEMSVPQNDDKPSLEILLLEKKADELLLATKPREAVKCLQKIIDSKDIADDEKGWYLQEMRYCQ
jgi:replicative superfamily II helicase